jgi:hypothetical protein
VDGSRFHTAKAIVLACATALSTTSDAWQIDIRGDIAAESRSFWLRQQYASQTPQDYSVALRPEMHWRDEPMSTEVSFAPFVRADSADPERSHADVRELTLSVARAWWELHIGVGRIFWGTAESNHLVDIINQTDLIENIDGEDKLGQPMLNLAFVRSWGTLDLFVLPWFRERTFPGKRGRLRVNPEIRVGKPSYESSAREHHVDFAVRYSVSEGGLDLGVYQFRGTAREPLLMVTRGSKGDIQVVPRYEQIDQTGLDGLYALGNWLFKVEALYQSSSSSAYAAAVGGFEYTESSVLGTTFDLGFLGELHWDSRGDGATTPFNHDVFVGARLSLNDVWSSQLLAGAVFDVFTGAKLISVEAERRLSERWKVSMEIRAFESHERRDPLSSLQQDDYMGLGISRYF